MERRFTANAVAGVRLTARAEGQPEGLSGYAAVFYDGTPGTEYRLYDDMVERIMPGAFDKALSERQDVRGLFNHDANQVLGRTSAGTMRLGIDAKGLTYDIDPGNTTVAKDVSEHVRRKDVTGSSFSFIPLEASWIEETKEGRTTWIREIRSVQLYDVGPVTFPAYEATTAGVRSRDDAADARKSLDAFRFERQQQNNQITGRLAQYAARSAEVMAIAESID